MRMLNSSLAVASLLGFFTAASCTLITDVDRTKIPTDAGAHAGETGTGGTGGTGGTTGGTGGGAGDTGMAGVGAEGGTGGTSQGGTGGTSQGGTGGSNAGTGGTSNPTPACDHATGRITVGEGTFISNGETFTVSDGLGDAVTFEFAYAGASAADGNVEIAFDGEPTPAEFAVKITNAINRVTNFGVTASTSAEAPSGAGGAGGAAGEGGAAGNSGATNGGAGGEGGVVIAPPPSGPQTVELLNDRAGALGNVKLKDTVGNPNFKVSGMSGGNAVLCDEDALCDSDAECESDSCVDNVCEQ